MGYEFNAGREEPEVIYVDSQGLNYFDPGRNVIVLDEQLREFPYAHQYVLRHEWGHVEAGRSVVKNVVHEVRNDLLLAFSNGREVRELREYFRESTTVSFDTVVLNMLRMMWWPCFVVCGAVWRKLRG